MSKSLSRTIWIVVILELLIAAFAIYTDGYTVNGLQTMTRLSGRLSLFIFSIIFLFRNKPGNLDVAILHKPYHFFALAHGIHLIQLLTFVYFSSNELNPIRLAGGFAGYVLIFLMPFATDRVLTNRISPQKYNALEIVFHYYIWFIFFMTYLPRVRGTLSNVGGNYWEHVALLGWVSVLLGMKLTGLIKFTPRTSK